MLGFFKPKSATDGAKESPVLMDGSNGGGASGDADVVTTGVVSRSECGAGAGSGADVVVTGVVSKGEGGAGAGSGTDVVVTGVVSKGEGGAGAGSFAGAVATEFVNGLEDCEGSGIDMDGVLSDAADGSGPADRTIVHAPIYCAGLHPAVVEPVLEHYPSTLHGIRIQGVSCEVWKNLYSVSLCAVSTASRGIKGFSVSATYWLGRGMIAHPGVYHSS